MATLNTFIQIALTVFKLGQMSQLWTSSHTSKSAACSKSHKYLSWKLCLKVVKWTPELPTLETDLSLVIRHSRQNCQSSLAPRVSLSGRFLVHILINTALCWTLRTGVETTALDLVFQTSCSSLYFLCAFSIYLTTTPGTGSKGLPRTFPGEPRWESRGIGRWKTATELFVGGFLFMVSHYGSCTGYGFMKR